MKRYRAEGVDCHHANMEVWDKRLFEWINPGQEPPHRLGQLGALDDRVGGGAGRGQRPAQLRLRRGVGPPHGFDNVADAVKSTGDGVDFMMRHGVFPRFNQWRREPGSDLVSQHEQPAIPLEFYIQIMRRYYESWKKYRLPLPPPQLRPPRAPLGSGHATYDDMLFLNDWPNYEEEWDRGSREGLKACVTRG